MQKPGAQIKIVHTLERRVGIIYPHFNWVDNVMSNKYNNFYKTPNVKTLCDKKRNLVYIEGLALLVLAPNNILLLFVINVWTKHSNFVIVTIRMCIC